MKLSELLSVLNIQGSSQADFEDTEIISVCHDSRRAIRGSVFVCKCGAISDGHSYAPAAYDKGARVFIAQRPLDLPSDALVITVENTERALTSLAQKFYDYPARDINIIGITGTKGKTTLALSVYDIASKYGINIGYVGTNGVLYGDVSEESVNTTPDSLELQRILSDMRDSGIDTVVIEVSSQALWQERIAGLRPSTCVFTNLYTDHIGGVEHPTFEHYRDCKKLLFSDYGAKNIITNSDSPYADFMTSGTDAQITSTSASGNTSSSLYATDIEKSCVGVIPGVSFNCHGDIFCGERVFIPLPGTYSVENALQTIAICRSLGIDKEFIISALSDLVISGRFETVTLETKAGVLFIIDYAHNGASLTSVLSALREYDPKRIICLFGSVGGRTYGRRAELAQAADMGADIIIVTSDNPGPEEPSNVTSEICSHLKDSKKDVYNIPDREQAIRFAVEIAQDGDFVLLAGKGHENYQLVRGRKISFSERDILRDIDTKKNNSPLFWL